MPSSSKPPYVFLDDQVSKKQRYYSHPKTIITANTSAEVEPALESLQSAIDRGAYLAGYFSYELGYELEPSLRSMRTKTPNGPLLQFGVFDTYSSAPPVLDCTQIWIENIAPHWSEKTYRNKFDQVLAYVRAGDVYQINLSFPISARTNGTALSLYQYLKPNQPAHFGAALDLGCGGIVSLSPELFFEKENANIRLRPMKGTIARGKTPQQDAHLVQSLFRDEKSRAENLMIVDLLRNDASRISQAGSVRVDALFQVETYPSLHTMTSSISAQLKNELKISDYLRALFPCGSVTGAPKIRAMEIIHELESRQRGVYCGAIGYFDPNGDVSLSVAIRTMSVSKNGALKYPVGSGIVSDSRADLEYEECLLKAQTLASDFGLFETLGWDEQTGYMHLDLHLLRLKNSARVLGFCYDEEGLRQRLATFMKTKTGPHKIRIELKRDGNINLTRHVFTPTRTDKPVKIALAPTRRDHRDPLVFHKTTKRNFLTQQFEQVRTKTGCEEMILQNELGEICEGFYSNIFVKKGDILLTPALSCGLLPGVLRQVLLETGQAKEMRLSLDDLKTAQAIYIGNSLRGLRPAQFVSL